MTRSERRRILQARSLAELQAWAGDLEQRVREHARRTAPKRAGSKAAKAGKRVERNARMAEIRARVMERARGRCELCGTPASEAHHVLGGGLRRHRESVETVLALCPECHRALHRSNETTLYQAVVVCRRDGLNEAAAALAHRLDKIAESQRRAG